MKLIRRHVNRSRSHPLAEGIQEVGTWKGVVWFSMRSEDGTQEYQVHMTPQEARDLADDLCKKADNATLAKYGYES